MDRSNSRGRTSGKWRFSLAVLAALGLLLAACAGADEPDSAAATDDADATEEASSDESSGDEEAGAYTIALMLPETAVARYETKDRPFFEERLGELCPDCEFLYANANGDAAEQQNQARSLLTQGVDVMVVDPIDGVAAATIVDMAKEQGVPVIAYDRLIDSPDLSFVITNDYEQVGVLQGQALIDKLAADGVESGGIIMMNGATTDNNAGNIKRGALSQIEGSGYEILASIDTWDPAEAQTWAAGQISQFGDQIVGVYSANDGNAGGAIAAFKAAGINDIPPMTGLDASLAGLQAIVAGNQYMTVYNAFRTEAEAAAEAAYAFAQGETPEAEAEVSGIPAILNPPTAVTIDTIMSTVVADDFFTVEEICTPEYADACAAAAIG